MSIRIDHRTIVTIDSLTEGMKLSVEYIGEGNVQLIGTFISWWTSGIILPWDELWEVFGLGYEDKKTIGKGRLKYVLKSYNPDLKESYLNFCYVPTDQGDDLITVLTGDLREALLTIKPPR